MHVGVVAGLSKVDSAGGTAGLCQPVERDIYDCYVTCFWPAQVPDHMNNYPDWASKCATATKDWRNLDLVSAGTRYFHKGSGS